MTFDDAPPDRRRFLELLAGLAAAAEIAWPSDTGLRAASPGGAGQSPTPSTFTPAGTFNGVQMGPHTILDEGIERTLDLLADTAPRQAPARARARGGRRAWLRETAGGEARSLASRCQATLRARPRRSFAVRCGAVRCGRVRSRPPRPMARATLDHGDALDDRGAMQFSRLSSDGRSLTLRGRAATA